jgi:hypothetical protein
MNSTPNPTATDPNDDLAARADKRLAHAYEQIARADEQLARVTENLSKLDQGAARKPSVNPDRRPSRGRSARRGLVGFLLAACIFLAAFIWQSSLGDAAKLMISRWVPQQLLTSPLPLKTLEASAQANSSAPLPVSAEPTSPTAPAQTVPQDVAPTAAPLPPELAQMLQTIARDLANVERGVEQLRSGQEQFASDTVRTIEQLRSSQDQMARDNAKTAEQLKAMASFTARASKQGVQPATPAAPLRANATATRQVAPTRAPPQTRVQP